MNEKIKLNWTLASSETREGTLSEAIPASVPGYIQEDCRKAFGLPSIHEGNNEKAYYGLEDKFWHYTAKVNVKKDGCPFLVLESVEYKYEVLIDGVKKAAHEGMFTRTETDLSEYRGKEVSVEVVIEPAQKLPGEPINEGVGWESAESCMPAFEYGWDWAPRFIVLGIVGDAYIEYRPEARLTGFEVSYRLNDTVDKADLTVSFLPTEGGDAVLTLTGPDGETLIADTVSVPGGTRFVKTLTLNNPPLWFPHNHGAQPLCLLRVELKQNGKTTDEKTRKLGFRRVRMVNNGNTVHNGDHVDLPATIEINCERCFGQGSNWVPSSLSYSEVEYNHVKTLLTLAKDANMNILRLWGGSFIQPDWFYDLCDELGIMLWQEFPLACAHYSEKDSYLAVLEQEATAIVKALRTHPSVVLFCGGNELFCGWSRCMTMQSKALRLLDAVSYRNEPEVPYWHSSPLPGIKHGAYSVMAENVEILQTFQNTDYLGYTEYGCGSVSDYDTLKAILTEEQLANPTADPIWQARHGERWAAFRMTSMITGIPENAPLSEMAAASNEVQANCYRSLFETVRQKWPHSSLSINWDYNEPWETLAGNELVYYPARPREAYYAVKEALRPTHLSLGFCKLSWKPGETVTLKPYLLNDSAEAASAGEATVTLLDGETVVARYSFTLPEAAPRSNVSCASLSFPAPAVKTGKLTMCVTSGVKEEWNAQYTLYIHK